MDIVRSIGRMAMAYSPQVGIKWNRFSPGAAARPWTGGAKAEIHARYNWNTSVYTMNRCIVLDYSPVIIYMLV